MACAKEFVIQILDSLPEDCSVEDIQYELAPTFAALFFGPPALGETRRARELILRSELYRWLKEKYEELRSMDAAQFERHTCAGITPSSMICQSASTTTSSTAIAS